MRRAASARVIRGCMPVEENKSEPHQAGRDSDECIALAEHAFVADRSGALFWPQQQTLLVADLHLEKGSAFAVRGRMLPPYDSRETLMRLGAALQRYAPKTVIALGDSLHDRGAAGRLDPADLEILQSMQHKRTWIWITGNHDPEIPVRLGGAILERLAIGRLTLQHAPALSPTGHEIAGHLHPVAKLVRHTRSIRRPCFIGNGQRLIMPAFGAFTGGLNVLDEAFTPLFPHDTAKIWMLGQDRVYPIAMEQLTTD